MLTVALDCSATEIRNSVSDLAVGEQVGFSPIDKLLLCYYEPFGGVMEAGQLDEILLENGFKMPFNSHILELDLDPKNVVMPLLEEVRRLGELGDAPSGNSGCKDCGLLEDMWKVIWR